jgi:cycloartenol synthase
VCTLAALHSWHFLTRGAARSYGLHIEGASTMFGTVLSYVSLRLLGLPAEHPTCAAARSWMLAHGGATAIPSWGKFWLAVLGVYSWEGLNPMPPEMWLLPYAFPAHPGRLWCHCRQVYLPMCYVYGVRGTGPASALTEALKQEIFCEDWAAVNWDKARSCCAKEDLYYPHPLVQDAIWYALHRCEPLLLGSRLRKAALAKAMAHIHYEDSNTRNVCIGPVNKVINMLCCFLEGGAQCEAFRAHLPRIADYLWVAEDGCKMQGYNGSQLWDTAFATQAMLSTGLAAEFSACVSKAYAYIDASQVREDCAPPLSSFYRHISKGAWPFSTRDHGWPISDCTAEGLKACIRVLEASSQTPGVIAGGAIAEDRLFDCVNIILSFQNRDGGWATYENTRGSRHLELLNPAETFSDIMVDYTYVECTSASIQALRMFARHWPQHRTEQLQKAIADGVHFILGCQRPDGSWYGSWGVCFTYGAWFGICGLVAAGVTWNGTCALKRAVQFLLDRQGEDGGWGESYLACQDKVWSPLEGGESHVVNTSWALLALLASGQQDRDAAPLHRAARCILQAQLRNGDWPQQHISGVFNRNCMACALRPVLTPRACSHCIPRRSRMQITATSSRCGRWASTRTRLCAWGCEDGGGAPQLV